MAIERSQDDAWTKEMAKWEREPVFVNGTFIKPIPFGQGGRGGSPLAEYPKVLYRAAAADGGPRIVADMNVDDADHERRMCSRGWYVDQNDAIQAVHDEHLEHARLAANRAASERGMSENARAEARAVDEATMQHVPSIPETPIVRRVAKDTSK